MLFFLSLSLGFLIDINDLLNILFNLLFVIFGFIEWSKVIVYICFVIFCGYILFKLVNRFFEIDFVIL